MSAPRILVVSPGWPADAADYRARFVWHHAQALAAAGARVRIIAPGDGPAPPGVQRLPVPMGRAGFTDGALEALAVRPLRASLAGLRLSRALGQATAAAVEPADRLVAHWLLPAGAIACRYAPGVAHGVAHGGDVALLERLPFGQALARRLERRLFLTFVSHALKRRYRDLLGRPFHRKPAVLPMGVAPLAPDAAFEAALRARAAGRPILATVGRLVPIKGLDVLADALAGGPPVLWCAAGEGPEGAALAAACAARGVAFAALGPLAPPQRDALLAAAAVFALPSRALHGRTEGTPVALLEALAAGVPTVASDTGGVAAAVGDAGARLVPPEDPAALRAALTALLSAPPAALEALRARHRAVGAGFSWAQLGPRHAARILGPSLGDG